MNRDEIRAFIRRQYGFYVADRVASGEEPEQAQAHANGEWSRYFPGGTPAIGHRLYRLMAGDQPAGILWLGPSPDGRDHMDWIYYVEIDEGMRGRGYGTAAMLIAEQDAAARGADRLGLNVFGGNKIARHLYESVGYQPTAINMVKRLSQVADE